MVGAMRAALYARLSKSTETSTSIARQTESARAYCQAQGWEVVETFVDDGVKGNREALDRPGLAAAIKAADDGAFGVLVFAKLDRLARSVRVFWDVVERLERSGVSVASVGEAIDTSTPGGRMVVNVLAAFAEFERDRIGERVRESRKALAVAGRSAGGPTPFGWRPERSPEGVRFVLEPSEASVVAEAVALVLEGLSVAEVARRLPGAPPHETLRRLLRSPILAGMRVYHGQPMIGPDGLPTRPHEALLSYAEWSALQRTLDTRAGHRAPPSRGLLLAGTGLLQCGHCGGTMSASHGPSRPPNYVCRGAGCTAIRAAGLDAFVEGRFLGAVGRLEVLREERLTDGATEALEAARERREAVRRMFAAGVLTEAEATADLAALGATVERLEALSGGPSVRLVSTGRTFGATWAEAPLGARQALLAPALEAVVVMRGRRGRGAVPPEERAEIIWRNLPEGVDTQEQSV